MKKEKTIPEPVIWGIGIIYAILPCIWWLAIRPGWDFLIKRFKKSETLWKIKQKSLL